MKKERGVTKEGEEMKEQQEAVKLAYKLFVAYQEQDEKAGDDDDDDDDDDDWLRPRVKTKIISWKSGCKKGLLGASHLDAVKEMSRKIFDESDKGFHEIDDAASRAPANAQAPRHINVVGMLVLRTEPPAEITQVHVLPAHRNSGIRKRLVRCALEYVSMKLKCSQVNCFATTGSESFYERLGFTENSKAKRTSKKGDTPCADRAEMVMKIEPGTHYDVESDDDDSDERGFLMERLHAFWQQRRNALLQERDDNEDYQNEPYEEGADNEDYLQEPEPRSPRTELDAALEFLRTANDYPSGYYI